jgi:hypothetical protein
MTNVSGTRSWEVSFMPHDAMLETVLVMETGGEGGAAGDGASAAPDAVPNAESRN